MHRGATSVVLCGLLASCGGPRGALVAASARLRIDTAHLLGIEARLDGEPIVLHASVRRRGQTQRVVDLSGAVTDRCKGARDWNGAVVEMTFGVRLAKDGTTSWRLDSANAMVAATFGLTGDAGTANVRDVSATGATFDVPPLEMETHPVHFGASHRIAIGGTVWAASCGPSPTERLYDLHRQERLLATVAGFRLDFAGATRRRSMDETEELTFSTVPIDCYSDDGSPDLSVRITVGANGTPTALYAYGSLLGETLDVKNDPSLYGLHFEIEPGDGLEKREPGVNATGSATVNGWAIAFSGKAFPSRCTPYPGGLATHTEPPIVP